MQCQCLQPVAALKEQTVPRTLEKAVPPPGSPQCPSATKFYDVPVDRETVSQHPRRPTERVDLKPRGKYINSCSSLVEDHFWGH